MFRRGNLFVFLTVYLCSSRQRKVVEEVSQIFDSVFKSVAK